MSKTDDIHNAILARASQPPAPRPTVAVGARPYVAEAGHRLAEGLREANQRLKAELSTGLLVLRLDPKRVRSTKFINRDERAFLDSDPKFLSLKESIRLHRQETPIRVRPVEGDPAFDYEVVYGHRRHRACLALDGATEGGFPVLALNQEVAERDLVLMMYRENEEREEQCALDKGRMFRRWLDEGVFVEQVDIAKAVGLSQGTVTRYLQVAELPAVVLSAFEDYKEISVRWASDLTQALKLDRAKVEAAAQRLASATPRPSAQDTVRTLVGAGAAVAKEERGSSPSREQAIKIDGRVALRVQRRDGRLTLKFYRLDKRTQKELAEELQEIAEKRIREKLKGSSS